MVFLRFCQNIFSSISVATKIVTKYEVEEDEVSPTPLDCSTHTYRPPLLNLYHFPCYTPNFQLVFIFYIFFIYCFLIIALLIYFCFFFLFFFNFLILLPLVLIVCPSIFIIFLSFYFYFYYLLYFFIVLYFQLMHNY